MGQVYGENPLGQILRVSAHWHWVQRQWVFSVTELSLDLKAQTSDKNQATGAFNASGNQNSDFPKTMKAKYVKTRLFVHFGCRRIWSSLFVEQFLLESLEYSTSCNTQLCHFKLDSRRIWQIWAKCLWFQTTGGPLGSWLCTSWGMVSQKISLHLLSFCQESVFLDGLSKVSFSGKFSRQQGDVKEVQWCTLVKRSSVPKLERKMVESTIFWQNPPPWFAKMIVQQTRRGGLS